MSVFISLFTIALNAILAENFILVKFMGICPFMGVSKKQDTALGMGIAVTFVMGIASAATWAVNEFLLVPLNLVYSQRAEVRHAPSAHESDDACLYPDRSGSGFFRHNPVHLPYFSRFPELHKTISPFLLRKSLPQPLQSCWSCHPSSASPPVLHSSLSLFLL